MSPTMTPNIKLTTLETANANLMDEISENETCVILTDSADVANDGGCIGLW